MSARRTRVVLVAMLVLALWLGLLAPQLWDERMRVLAFLGIVAVAAWGWARTARAKAPGDVAPEDAPADPVAPGIPAAAVPAPELGAELTAEHKLGE